MFAFFTRRFVRARSSSSCESRAENFCAKIVCVRSNFGGIINSNGISENWIIGGQLERASKQASNRNTHRVCVERALCSACRPSRFHSFAGLVRSRPDQLEAIVCRRPPLDSTGRRRSGATVSDPATSSSAARGQLVDRSRAFDPLAASSNLKSRDGRSRNLQRPRDRKAAAANCLFVCDELDE